MNTFLQNLCRVQLSGLATGCAGVLLAAAAQASPTASTTTSATASTATSPTAMSPNAALRQQMLAQAGAWLSRTQGQAENTIQFAPLDDRVMVRACATPLQFDMPFASRETVRVRCGTQVPSASPSAPSATASNSSSSGWQLYLRWVNAGQAPSADLRAESRAEPKSGQVMRKVLVAKQQLQRGTRLSPEMFEVVEMVVPHWTPAMLDSTKEVAQMEMVRDIPAGSVLQGFDARKAILVKQGQMAQLTLGEGKGFQISVKVEALQDGRLGEQIRLKNAESGKILSGVVSGASAVRGI
jgi:flagella basal body P-ring formation protein FlgA